MKRSLFPVCLLLAFLGAGTHACEKKTEPAGGPPAAMEDSCRRLCAKSLECDGVDAEAMPVRTTECVRGYLERIPADAEQTDLRRYLARLTEECSPIPCPRYQACLDRVSMEMVLAEWKAEKTNRESGDGGRPATPPRRTRP